MNIGAQQKLYSIINNRIGCQESNGNREHEPPKRDCSHTHKTV